jgi:FtsP/CotA-like multicopper oxidase with cupredoxin domain
LGWGLAGCAGDDRVDATLPSGRQLVMPKELRSVDGVLDIDLRVARADLAAGSGRRFAYTYDGTSPGPTLRVRPGDTVTVRLRNDLDESTNLHTHGLHVDPSGSSDNVFVEVQPRSTHTYTYRIPDDHRSGTFWYHPHHHGMVAAQVSAGLFGVIIVEDDLDTLPDLGDAAERLLVLNDPRVGSDASVLDVSAMEVMQGREGDATLVNGQDEPVIPAETGRLEHWRIVNASPSRYYRMALEGHALHLIGTDGGRLSEPTTVDEVLIAPGERVEVMVALTEGRHELRSLGYDRGSAGMGGGMMGGRSGAGSGPQVLAVVDTTVTSVVPPVPGSLADPATTRLPGPTASRRLELAMGMGGGMGGGMMGGGGSGGGMMAFTIDGVSFDPSRTDIAVRAGSVEEWTLVNTSPMDHPFHLHVWPFQVVDAQGRGDGRWKDTVNVPARSTVTIRVRFSGLTGRTVYHCHILDHEDQGMMGVIEVR